MENEHCFEGTNENANFVQKKSKGALRNTFIKASPYNFYKISKNMENEHYFEGTNENSNFVQKKSK